MLNSFIKAWKQARPIIKIRAKAKPTIRQLSLFINNLIYPFLSKADIHQIANLSFKASSIIDPHEVLSTPPTLIESKWGGMTPNFHNYEEGYLENISKSLDIYRGSPEVHTYRNGYLHPWIYMLVYE